MCKQIRLILIVDQNNKGVSIDDFPKTRNALTLEQISFYTLSLRAAFEGLQQGQLSPETTTTLRKLRKLVDNQPLTSPTPIYKLKSKQK